MDQEQLIQLLKDHLNYYPKEFSSYEEYIKYLKEIGFALEAP